MNEIISLVLLLGIFFVISLGFMLSGGGGYVRKASKTDPFPSHIHVVTNQADIDALPCPEPECFYHDWKP